MLYRVDVHYTIKGEPTVTTVARNLLYDEARILAESFDPTERVCIVGHSAAVFTTTEEWVTPPY